MVIERKEYYYHHHHHHYHYYYHYYLFTFGQKIERPWARLHKAT